MGLDWLAGNRPQPGHEDEFRRLLSLASEGEIDDEQRDRFGAISIPAYSQVGAPVVGTDRIADAWVLANVRSNGEHESTATIELNSADAHLPHTDEERTALAEMAGYHVLELAPGCDGLPLYSHGGMMDELDLTSFRGKFLHDCEDIIGQELLEQAYEDQLPEQLVAYGKTLIDHARRYASQNGCADVEQQQHPPDEIESPRGRAHILFAAGRWCVFWGARGHYLDTWF
jgi:hypothetical protein